MPNTTNTDDPDESNRDADTFRFPTIARAVAALEALDGATDPTEVRVAFHYARAAAPPAAPAAPPRTAAREGEPPNADGGGRAANPNARVVDLHRDDDAAEAADEEAAPSAAPAADPEEVGTLGGWQTAVTDDNQPDDRVGLRGVDVGRSEHEQLTAVVDLADPGDPVGVPVARIREAMPDASKADSLRALYRALLVERTSEALDNGGWRYRYRPTDHGVAEIETSGRYEPGMRHAPDADDRVADRSLAVNAGTARHETLAAMPRPGSDDWLSANELGAQLHDAKPSSGAASAYELTVGGFADRKRLPRGAGGKVVWAYQRTPKGQARYNVLGPYPAPDEDTNENTDEDTQ